MPNGDCIDMANEQNLKPFGTLTESEQREIRSKGGKASGDARRERKTIAECLNRYLDEEVESGLTRRELLAMKVIKNAFDKGEAKDLKILTELVGELKQKVELDSKGTIAILPDSAIEAIQKNAK